MFWVHQLGIAVFGSLAVWLSQDQRYLYRRWACIAGLAGEPFWLWSAWEAEQWGVIVMTAIYTAGWGRGLYGYWIRGGSDG